MNRNHSWMLLAMLPAAVGTGCAPTQPNPLDKLGTVRMEIKGQPFELWVADEAPEQLRGLMFITAEQMAPLPDGTERGMIFIFDHSVRDSFWMKNTIIPLDIAYVAADGSVVSNYTMIALDDRHNQYPPAAPYRFAIEVNAERFKALGLKPGDRLDLPAGVLKTAP
ncbi:MAG: DUF192 domain-containing protein [Planctomycetes bacterium]|nr:DUF192 domain-containing protein [Planctomycetota bacterium]